MFLNAFTIPNPLRSLLHVIFLSFPRNILMSLITLYLFIYCGSLEEHKPFYLRNVYPSYLHQEPVIIWKHITPIEIASWNESSRLTDFASYKELHDRTLEITENKGFYF